MNLWYKYHLQAGIEQNIVYLLIQEGLLGAVSFPDRSEGQISYQILLFLYYVNKVWQLVNMKNQYAAANV